MRSGALPNLVITLNPPISLKSNQIAYQSSLKPSMLINEELAEAKHANIMIKEHDLIENPAIIIQEHF
jgi:hypothetical protein